MSDDGAHFWGRHGAAGLLLRAPGPDGGAAVLLQHRAPWSHQGGTWGLPGGARDSHETVEEAAVREAHEEAGLTADRLTVRTTVVTAHASGSDWTYTTVIADAPGTAGHGAQPGERRIALGGRGRRRRPPATPGVRGQLGAASHRDRRRSRCWSTRSRERGLQVPRGRGRVVGRGDGPHHHDSARPRGDHLGQPLRIDAPDREPRFRRSRFRRRADEIQSWRGPAGFGRGGPARPDAEVVHLLGDRRWPPVPSRAWTARSAGRVR